MKKKQLEPKDQTVNKKDITIFISCCHEYNQGHANKIAEAIIKLGYKVIKPTKWGDIKNLESKSDEDIKKEIRERLLNEADVTIIILGKKTALLRHIDWEIRSSIHKSNKNKMGAIVVVNTLRNNVAWFTNDKSLELAHARKFPKNIAYDMNNCEWLPNRLVKSISNLAIFPIIRYHAALSTDILDKAIQTALKATENNFDKWDIKTPLQRENINSNSAPLLEQYPE